jgi:hypothetical protein
MHEPDSRSTIVRPLFANDVFRFSSTEFLYHIRVFSSQSNLLWYSILGRGFVLLPSRLSEKNGNMPMDEHSGGRTLAGLWRLDDQDLDRRHAKLFD